MTKDFFQEMQQFRCSTCNKLLFKYRLKGSLKLEIKCTRCNETSTLIIENQEK